MRLFRLMLLGLLAFSAASSATGTVAETITYKYDARGRLIEVKRSGPAHPSSNPNGIVTTYGHDKANNRTSKATTGSPNPPPP